MYYFECQDGNYIYPSTCWALDRATVEISFTAETPAYDYVIPVPGSPDAPLEGATLSAQVTTIGAWTAESQSDWLTVDTTEGNPKDILHITATENTAEFRVGEIEMASGSETYTLYVRQAGSDGLRPVRRPLMTG